MDIAALKHVLKLPQCEYAFVLKPNLFCLVQGQAINFSWGHLWKAACSGGPYLLTEIEASL